MNETPASWGHVGDLGILDGSGFGRHGASARDDRRAEGRAVHACLKECQSEAIHSTIGRIRLSESGICRQPAPYGGEIQIFVADLWLDKTFYHPAKPDADPPSCEIASTIAVEMASGGRATTAHC